MNATSPATNCLSLHHQDMALVQLYGKEEVFSLPAWSKDKVNSAKTPLSKGENRIAKRKLYSPGGALSEDEDKKVTPKRRRSLLAADESSSSTPPPPPTPASSGHQASGGSVKSGKSTPGGGGTGACALRMHTVPLSERQQLQMLMQMTAADDVHHQCNDHQSHHSPYSSTGSGLGAGGLQHGWHPSGAGGPMSPHSVGRRTPSSAGVAPSSAHASSGDRKLHKRNERGETPLHLAAIRGDVKQIKKLIRNGVDVNVTDYAGWTPLHEACNLGYFDIARQLINAGANVNIRGLDNDTPLHDASVNGHVNIVKLLMDHGANPLQSNLKGKTPVDVSYNDDILRLLQRRPDTTTSQTLSDRLSVGAQSSAATDSCDDGTMSPPMSASPLSTGSTSPRSSSACVNSHSDGYKKSVASSSPPASNQQQHGNSAADPSRLCSSRKSTPSAVATSNGSTPPSSSGVLKNVHVSHHMGRSQLTLKFHHVKRHENGVSSSTSGDRSSAADSRVPASKSSTTADASSSSKNQLLQASPPMTNGLRRSTAVGACNSGVLQNNIQHRGPSISTCDGVSLSNSVSSWSAHEDEGSGCGLATQTDRLGTLTVSTSVSLSSEDIRNGGSSHAAVPSPHLPPPALSSKPFSPQFEDISDAEDETTASLVTVPNGAPIVPLDAAAGLCGLGSMQAHVTPISVGMYPIQSDAYSASGAFFSAAATAGGSMTAALPLGSWSGFGLQPPLPVSGSQFVSTSTIAGSRPPYFVTPSWIETDRQNSFSPVMCKASLFGGMTMTNGGGFEAPAPLKISPVMNGVTAVSSVADSLLVATVKEEVQATAHFSSKVSSRNKEAVSENKGEFGGMGAKQEIVIKSEHSLADDGFAYHTGKLNVDHPIKMETKPKLCLWSKPETDFSSSDDYEEPKRRSITQSKEMLICGAEQEVLNAVDSLTSMVMVDRTETDFTVNAVSPSLQCSPRSAGIYRGESLMDSSSSGSRPSTPAAASTSSAVPKVPPLRIIIPSKTNCSTTAADSVSNSAVVTSKTGSGTTAVSLPYVVNVPHDTGAEESLGSDHAHDIDQCSESESLTGQAPGMSESESTLKEAIAAGTQYDSIMTRRRKIKQPKKDEEKSCNKVDVTVAGNSNSSEESKQRISGCSETDETLRNEEQGSAAAAAATAERRVTRAAARSQNQQKAPTKERAVKAVLEKETPSSAGRNDADKESWNGQTVETAASSSSGSVSSANGVTAPDDDGTASVQANARKHKKLHRAAASSDSPVAENQMPIPPLQVPFRKPSNPYTVYRSITMKVADRKSRLCCIVPKGPAHFSEYALIKRRYVLHDSLNSSQQLIPTLTPAPTALPVKLRDLFTEQEQARNQLKLQHIKERERLALLYEQETLRVHCHSARAHADASHSAVLSVCSLLSIDEGLYGGGTTSQGSWGGCASGFMADSSSSHEDREQRARFGTRHFFTWMQDVQEKFYRLKEEMRLRHHHEADVLCAVQRLDWEWKMRAIGASSQSASAIASTSTVDTADATSTPIATSSIEIYVPLVVVDDDLNLQPV